MKKITMIFTAMAVCFFLALSSNSLVAQDARNNTTTVDDIDDEDDNSNWGLLGLLGLTGLLGLKKKDRDVVVDDRNRSSQTNVNR